MTAEEMAFSQLLGSLVEDNLDLTNGETGVISGSLPSF